MIPKAGKVHRGKKRRTLLTGEDYWQVTHSDAIEHPEQVFRLLRFEVFLTEEDRMELNQLTEDELLFVNEYMRDYNGTQACIRSEIETEPDKAKGKAQYYLSLPRVKDYIHNEETKADGLVDPRSIIRRAALLERLATESGDLKLAVKCHEIYLKEKTLWESARTNESSGEDGATVFRWDMGDEDDAPVDIFS